MPNSAASPGLQDEVLVAEYEPKLPVEDVEPFVTLVHLRLRLRPGCAGMISL